MKTFRKIVVCKKCKGTGHVSESTWPDLRDGGSRIFQCPECSGNGRKLRIVQITELPIFDEELKKIV